MTDPIYHKHYAINQSINVKKTYTENISPFSMCPVNFVLSVPPAIKTYQRRLSRAPENNYRKRERFRRGKLAHFLGPLQHSHGFKRHWKKAF